MVKNTSIRDYTPSRSNPPQTAKVTTPTKTAPPPKEVATATPKPKSDSVQISPAAQQAYKKDIEKTPVQARIVPEGAGAGGGSSSKPKNDTKPTNSSNTVVKESKDKDSKDKISDSIITVTFGSATGAGSAVMQEYKDYNNRIKVAEAARKMNDPTGTPRIAPADPIKGGLKGAGVGAIVGTFAEVGKNIYEHYDNISKTKGYSEAIAQAVEDGVLAPSEPYASMPTPQEIRNSKNKRDHEKESIKDHITKEVKEAVDKVKDLFKW
ncbi:hypothetical protein [Brevibacillus choshinensis]|uniref:hypothetical protein n=1 Tax=Brevibacillus choshinensis TaxID=54911 RepID=UPI002E1D33BC|nr:hypothetical protein [Brevibacillus choshinensis]